MKKIQDISIEGRIANNLIFILCDMIEVLSSVAENESAKAGFKWDSHTQLQLNKIKYAAKDMRKRTVETSEESQLTFGEDADKIATLILTAIDRTGNDDRVMDIIINYAKSFGSKLNLKLNKFGI